jgi:hypothetical protein
VTVAKEGEYEDVARLLLDDRYAPITSEIGFLECEAEATVARYLDWQTWAEQQPDPFGEPRSRPPWPAGDAPFVVRPVSGDLETALAALLPLTDAEPTRVLFVPTASVWTAYFDNGWRGTDAFPPMSYLAQHLGTRGLRVVAIPGDDRRSAATILELYGPKPTEWLNTERAISALHDGDRWRFDAVGEPLPFEDVGRYRAARVRDRFPLELLERYLAELGAYAFEDGFYMAGAPASLLESRRPRPKETREYGLAEARWERGIPPSTALPTTRVGWLTKLRARFGR